MGTPPLAFARVGFRDLFCPRYEECLDQTAYANEPLNFHKCQDRPRGQRKLEESLTTLGGCLKLLKIVFQGDDPAQEGWPETITPMELT